MSYEPCVKCSFIPVQNSVQSIQKIVRESLLIFTSSIEILTVNDCQTEKR